MPSDQDTPLSIEEIAVILTPFTRAITLSSFQLEQIREYIELLMFWNRTISLTAIGHRREIVTRHFGESIFAASAVPIPNGRLADVGTGAGFPGLPLKIISADIEVVLLEPNQKKCAFLNEVKRKLGLEHVEICRSKFEEYSLAPNLRFDFVLSRALGDYRRLLRWAETVLGIAGEVALWLGEEDSILVGRTKCWSWELPIRIPESARRVIQVGRPINR